MNKERGEGVREVPSVKLIEIVQIKDTEELHTEPDKKRRPP